MRPSTHPDHSAWLASVQEPILEPERDIVDPHHHLWDFPSSRYLLEEFWTDTQTGHKITQSVYMECGAFYKKDGPDHLKPVGETERVAEIAAISAAAKGQTTIAGIIAHADLSHPSLEETLEAHESAGNGLFRGIRHAGASDEDPAALVIPGRAPADLYQSASYRNGVRLLGAKGLTHDTWHYHHQTRAYIDLVRSAPDTQFVLDHFGTPLGVGRFENAREDIFSAWRKDITDLAELDNVVLKLGGLAMPDNGFRFHEAEAPPSTDVFLAHQRRYYDHALEAFGADRCMFESNFPVDRWSISYPVLWNALKTIARELTEHEKQALFSGTARRIYRLPEP